MKTAPAAKLGAMRGAADLWDSALARWNETGPAAFLRAYSDAVNERLLAEWLPHGRARRLLKTDLFDEAVGAGLVASLQKRATEVVAIDVSPAVVELARSRHPGMDARPADTRALPFEDGAFDVVLSNSTLDHFESLTDVRAALAELRRVLEPGGRLVLTLDNGANPLVLLRNALPESLLSRLRLVPYPIGVTCGPRRLRRVLRQAGFEVEASRGVMHCPRVLARAASALAPGASRGLLKGAMAFERLGRFPTRYLTAQFVAASARRL
jgi:SAM-dependent methyltransferase